MLLGVAHVKIFRPKNSLFLAPYFMSPLCSHFFLLFHKLNLLFLRFEFAQESKIFQEMDMNDVQNRDRRKTFGKIRRALGVLRNFFRTLIERPYMQW